MIITGSVIKYGDNISTDLIYPGRYTYLALTDAQMAEHALEDLDPGFAQRDVRGSIIVAGENWGCGSAREQAVKCLKAKGIQAVIAKSIARIYYRNCINEGLLPIVCPKATELIKNGDVVTIDIKNSEIIVGETRCGFSEFPPFVLEIIQFGGLIERVKSEVIQGREKDKSR